MRTTLNLNDGLMQKAKQAAAASGETLTSVVEAALRDYLDSKKHVKKPPAALPVSRCRGGLQTGIQLESTSELLHELDSADARF